MRAVVCGDGSGSGDEWELLVTVCVTVAGVWGEWWWVYRCASECGSLSCIWSRWWEVVGVRMCVKAGCVFIIRVWWWVIKWGWMWCYSVVLERSESILWIGGLESCEVIIFEWRELSVLVAEVVLALWRELRTWRWGLDVYYFGVAVFCDLYYPMYNVELVKCSVTYTSV